MKRIFDRIDKQITDQLKRIGPDVLRYSVAIVFIWFGLLKIFSVSPAQELVQNTVYWVSSTWFIPFLGFWELIIGLFFLYKPLVRAGIFLLLPQMIGTFLPLILLPDVTFTAFPHGLSMEGQYIVKNLVIIAAAIVIGGHVRDKT